MIIKRNISKQTISELPKAFFPGRIFVVQTETEAEKAVEYLSSQKVIGIDSETRPSFTKGNRTKWLCCKYRQMIYVSYSV